MTLSPIKERIVIPARTGRAVELTAGQRARLVDLEGQQVADVFCFARGDMSEFHSASHTRAHVRRSFPALGEEFVSNRRRPMLTVAGDTSPGEHDMLIAACDPARYEGFGVPGWHASCEQNLHEALAHLGLKTGVVPQPINVFMRIGIGDGGDLEWLPALSRPGDAVTFEALMDCVLVASACPQDMVVINGAEPTSLAIDLL